MAVRSAGGTSECVSTLLQAVQLCQETVNAGADLSAAKREMT